MKKNIGSAKEAFRQAFTSIRGNKLRAFLTTLGIVIGVMTVIGMVAIIQGLNSSMIESMQSMGPHLIQFTKQDAITFHRQTREQRMRKPLYYPDALAMREFSSAIKVVSAEVYNYEVTLKYGNEKSRNLSFAGVEPGYAECNNSVVDEGRFLTFTDLQHATSVIVLGADIVEALFPSGMDPIGKTVTADGHKFKVVGKFKKKTGGFEGGGSNRYAVIPFTTFVKIYPEIYRERGIQINAIPRTAELMDEAIDQGTAVLRTRRGVRPDQSNNFGTLTPDNLIGTYNQITGAIYLVMVVISSIGLMVGGVGVMNIMLVTVKERTREIGLRKALGARSRDILFQFLIEAVILCLIGGALGIAAGSIVAVIVKAATPLPAKVSLNAIAAAVGVSSSVGLFFGLYPARRAAKQDPILALHYE